MAATKTLKIFHWSDYSGNSFYLACGSKAAACRASGIYPRSPYAPSEGGNRDIGQLAAERPGTILVERRDGRTWGEGFTVYEDKTPVAKVGYGGEVTRIDATVAPEADATVTPEADATLAPRGDRSALRHVRLGLALDEALRRESERTGALPSEVVRRALRAYLS